MNIIRLQPLVLPKDVVIKCPDCGKTVSRGSVIVISAENGEITGLLPDNEAYCCGNHGDGPLLFTNLDKAARFVAKLASTTQDKTIELLPIEPILTGILRSVGSNLSEANRLYKRTAQIEKITEN